MKMLHLRETSTALSDTQPAVVASCRDARVPRHQEPKECVRVCSIRRNKHTAGHKLPQNYVGSDSRDGRAVPCAAPPYC